MTPVPDPVSRTRGEDRPQLASNNQPGDRRRVPPVRIDRLPSRGEPSDYPALEDFFACFSMRFSFKVFSGFFLVSFFAS